MGIFPDAQGQLTPQSLVRSGRIWNSSEMPVIDGLVTSKFEEDPIKNEGARVLTTFPHYNPMMAICCDGNPSKNLLLKNRWTDLQKNLVCRIGDSSAL